MILVDEYLAIRVISESAPDVIAEDAIALTYGRAYRLSRALLDVGPGRLQLRGRFTRLVEGLTPEGQELLTEWLADPDPAVLSIVDPRPLIGTAAAVQNTYAVSLLQAETLAAGAFHEWSIRFGDPDSATAVMHRAAQELGLDLSVLGD
jgi:hypothetical protein